MVPFDDQSPFVTSGIRIGTPAMTTRGFGEEEFKRVAELIDKVLENRENVSIIQKVKNEVNAMCDEFPLYDFVTT